MMHGDDMNVMKCMVYYRSVQEMRDVCKRWALDNSKKTYSSFACLAAGPAELLVGAFLFASCVGMSDGSKQMTHGLAGLVPSRFVVQCHAPNTFGTVNMEHTIDLSLSWSKR